MTLRTSELIKKSKEDIERGKGSRRNGHPCRIQRKERRGPNSIRAQWTKPRRKRRVEGALPRKKRREELTE